jgi:hypothetical protein
LVVKAAVPAVNRSTRFAVDARGNMKPVNIFSLPVMAACLALLAGCANLFDSEKPGVFGPYSPGGPVYQPQELVADKPMPSEPPFGTYFEDADKSAPASFADPYWIRGYWAWKNNDWEWIPARWVERPRPGLLWINAHSSDIGSRTFWQTGYWQ